MTWTMPEGQRLHGCGSPMIAQNPLPEYEAAMGEDYRPSMLSFFLTMPGQPSRWPQAIAALGSRLIQCYDEGRALNLALGFQDADVAAGLHDDKIAQIHGLAEIYPTVPIYLRIGVEVNWPGKGHVAGVFPLAWAKIRSIVTAPNVNHTYNIHPGGFTTWNEPLWMPAEVDTFGVSIFGIAHLRADELGPEVARLIQFAEARGKRVIIGESSPADVDADDDEWWSLFYTLLEQCPIIEAVQFFPVDWTGSKHPWGDKRWHLIPAHVDQVGIGMDALGFVHAPLQEITNGPT